MEIYLQALSAVEENKIRNLKTSKPVNLNYGV